MSASVSCARGIPGLDEVSQYLGRHVQTDVVAGQTGEGEQADQRPFELPDVILDVLGHVEQHIIGDDDVLLFDFLLQDRDAFLEVRRLDIGDQPPLEAGA